jgi:acetyl-CoA carboxylase biotin carboxyl carrier protein
MTRLHAPRLDLLVEELAADAAGRSWTLRSPAPGSFRPLAPLAAWCAAGTPIGTLDVLGRTHLLVVPPGVAGVTEPAEPAETQAAGASASSLSPRAIAYRDPIVRLSSRPQPGAIASDATAPAAAIAATTDGLVFRAPTSGRFYGRSAPDKPPFVAPGAQLAHGATICLLEVMKTFHRVTYGGPGLPDTARVRGVLVADGDDVSAGDPLLALE